MEKELRTWGVESGVEADRAIRKSSAAAIGGVGKGKGIDVLGFEMFVGID